MSDRTKYIAGLAVSAVLLVLDGYILTWLAWLMMVFAWGLTALAGRRPQHDGTTCYSPAAWVLPIVVLPPLVSSGPYWLTLIALVAELVVLVHVMLQARARQRQDRL